MYELELIITPNGPNTLDEPLVVEYDLNILGCIFDTITVENPIGDVPY